MRTNICAEAPSKVALIVLLLGAAISPVQGQNIQTIAGGGPNNLPATSIGLPGPRGIAVDSSGNVYVSLIAANQIWKITPLGNTTLFAGSGVAPNDLSGVELTSPDGVPAVSAVLNGPTNLLFDRFGNLLFSDTYHNRVRKISPTGLLSTVAGTGVRGFSGDGGAATAALLSQPAALAMDSQDNLYIADNNNYRVRVVSSSGVISTFAGNGTFGSSGDGGSATLAGLSSISGIAVDSTSAVYIGDGGIRVRKVSGGAITTIAGNGGQGDSGDNGPAISASLAGFASLTIDRFDNLFIVESNKIREIPANSATIITYAGSGQPGYGGDGGALSLAGFDLLQALAFDSSGSVAYLADFGQLDQSPRGFTDFAGRIRRISNSTISTFAGNGTLDYNGNGLSAINNHFLSFYSLQADNQGSLFFIDTGSFSIHKLALSNGSQAVVAGSGFFGSAADGSLAIGNPIATPYALAAASNGGIYFSENCLIRKVSQGRFFTIAGGGCGFSGDGYTAGYAAFDGPYSLALASNGDLYIADEFNFRVRIIHAFGSGVATIAGTGANGYSGDNGLATNASLSIPSAISLDGLGNLYVADSGGSRIRKIVLSTNIITTVAGDGTTNFSDGVLATNTGLSGISGLFVDESANIFVAEQRHSRIRMIAAGTNIISTVAGNGVRGFSGDGGPAAMASIDPVGIAIDRAQNLYIADNSGRIRTTAIQACFFTPSFSNLNINSAAGTGSVMITATNASCPYSAASNSPFLIITSGASGIGSGTVSFSVSTNPAVTARAGTLAIAAHTLTITQAGAALTADSVSPASGAGYSQTFTATFSDSADPRNLTSEQILINGSLNNTSACSIYTNSVGFYLFNDAGTALLGPVQSGTLSNSQCALTITTRPVIDSDNSRIVSVSLNFTPAFSGAKYIYLYATDQYGNSTGFQNRGSYTIPAPVTTPTADSLTPNSGSGSTQIFSATFSDPNGYSNLTSEQLLINSSLSNSSACSLYVNSAGFYLFNDAGTSLTGPAPQGGSLSNSQCTLFQSGSSVSGSGASRTVSFNLTFSNTFGGAKTLFAYATNTFGNSSGFQNRGTYTVPFPVTTPSSASVSPSAASGTSQAFTAVYSDADGYTNLVSEQLLINSNLSNTNACSLYVNSSGFYLFNDAGTVLMGPAPQGGTLTNRQCTFSQSGSLVSGSGNNRTVVYNLSFTSAFGGTESLFAYTTNSFNNNSGFQNRGTYSVPLPPTIPTSDSIAPNAGSGSSQTFTAVYSDTNGYANLTSEQLLINSSLSNTNACSLYVNNSGFYLFNDAGTVLTGPAAQGGTLSNSQCTFSQTGSSVTGSGNSRTINFRLTFTPSFTGAKSLYLFNTNASGNNSGFQNRGTFTVQ